MRTWRLKNIEKSDKIEGNIMKYEPNKIEPKWQKVWAKEGIYEPDLDAPKKPFFNLMMFPYPSAEGLHVGNMYAFTGADIYGRMKRMQGYDVFEPIGLDGFGIHSENYALKIGTHPMDQAETSEKRFYKQLESIGNGFAWNEHLETYDPEYYRWTQWIFTQMWKHGLAYRKKQSVNWCPKDLTVLSDEQIEGGKCERCGAEVIKKELEQWFFKITDYAERLLKNLDTLDWSEKVKIAQRNWTGKSEGALITFKLRKVPGQPDDKHLVQAFTTRPDTLFGATFLVVSPELAEKWMNFGWQVPAEVKKYIDASLKRKEMDRLEEGKEKTGIFTGVYAVNPANKEEIPVWVADYVLGSYGTGAIMAVPAHDERDFEFAKKFKLPIIKVIRPILRPESKIEGAIGVAESEISVEGELWEGNGELANSGKFNGMDSEKAKWEITKFVGGEKKVQFRLRDWLISRQRYWGPPIPMIHCEACAAKGAGENKDMPGWYAVPETDLPVELPRIKNFRPTGSGVSPLAAEKSFYEVKCPKCGGKARRETDVSDTFLDSAWYYLRYLDPENKKTALNEKRVAKWLPTKMYTGGAEHAVLHLLYVRFVAMALHDWKLVKFEEPFKKFRAHGLLIKDGAKMSKSKGNVINPDEYIKNFGADTLRMYLMFLAPFEQGGDFRDSGVLGIERFLKRVWQYAEVVIPAKAGIQNTVSKKPGSPVKPGMTNRASLLHKTIKKVSEDIEKLHYNTAVSALMILLHGFEDVGGSKEDLEVFLKLLAPFAPHMTEEIWRETLGHKTSIHRELWPICDEKLTREEKFTLVIQVNGKVRDTIEVDAGISEADAKKLALSNEKIKNLLGSREPKKVIYVPKKLVNIVV